MSRLDLGRFHVLVGPNGSGKSTFLDAIEFIKDCVTDGPLRAVEMRVPDFLDLTFGRKGGPIEFELRLSIARTPDAKPETFLARPRRAMIFTAGNPAPIRTRFSSDPPSSRCR